MNMNKFSGGCNTAAQWTLVAAFGAFPIALGLANALMLLAVMLWCLGGQWADRWQAVSRNPVAWLVLVLYGLMLLGVLYTPAPAEDWQLHLKKYIKLPMMVVWLALLWQAASIRRHALNAFAAAMAFTAASTWLNVWFQLPWSQSQNQGWGVTHHVFGDYITQNVMMALFVLLALFRARAGQAWVRWGWAATALLAAVSITHLSDGRTGYVLLAVAVGVFILTQLTGKVAVAAVLAGLLGLAGLLATSDTMRARFDMAIAEAKRHDTDNASSIGHRLYNYKTAPKLVAEKPLLGWGTGAYHTEICRVLDKPEECPMYSWHPHNQYLFFAAEHGVVGLGLYLALLTSMVWVAFRATDPQARTLLLGLTALLAVNSLFNSPLWSARESHFFTLMGALLASMAWVSRSSTSVK